MYEELNGSSLKNPGWPPSMDANKDVWGMSGCHYEGNPDGAGLFECDVDPQSDQQFECNAGFTDDTFVPRLRCTIPAANGA